MGRVKRNIAFEHAQNVRIHINLRMCRVSSGPSLSIDTGYSNDSGSGQSIAMILAAGSEGPDQTARMRSLIWAFADRVCQEPHFRLARQV